MTFRDMVFGPVCIVTATLDGSGGHAFCIWMCRAGHSPVQCEGLGAAAGHIAAVTVAGHGVVSKPSQSPLAQRVQAAPDTFLWSGMDDEVSFVRRERLQRLLGELAAAGVYPQSIYVGLEPGDAAFRSRERLRLRNLFGVTVERSAAAQAVVRRTGPTVLAACLLSLLANALLAPQLQARRQELQSELTASERTVSAAASAEIRQRELRAAFDAESVTAHAALCDRIAAAVPERVVLSSLDIEPPAPRLEAGKPLVRKERMAVICGTAPSAADISEFAARLGEVPALRDVRLANVERERDGELLAFRIESNL